MRLITDSEDNQWVQAFKKEGMVLHVASYIIRGGRRFGKVVWQERSTPRIKLCCTGQSAVKGSYTDITQKKPHNAIVPKQFIGR